MNVDRRHPHAPQEVATEDLHVASQHQQVALPSSSSIMLLSARPLVADSTGTW